MEKKAQERSVLNKLREKINIPTSYVEGFFKPELDRVMSSLKELDDRVRSVLVGKQIGGGEAPTDNKSVKDLLKDAQTNFNRREYMTGVSDLGRFHKKLYDITRDIDQFFVDVNKIHHKFLFEGVDSERLNQLRQHMDTISQKKAATLDYFIKEAGIMDFFYNLGTKRGRSMAAYEKKYPKQIKNLREGGLRVLGQAQSLLESTLGYLKQMATARATRRPDDYMDTANKIKIDFMKFDKLFQSYYNDAVAPWLKIKDEIEAKQQAERPEEVKQDISNKVELGGETPSTSNLPIPLVNVKQPIPPAPVTQPSLEEEAPPTDKNPQAPPDGNGKIRVADNHSNFYYSLMDMVNNQESPTILAKYIAKYASSIQSYDFATAVHLFKIANSIGNDNG